jgi:carboxymethylenebutenolidase
MAILALAGSVIAGVPYRSARAVGPVTVDRTVGEGVGPRPAVLLLHGSDGVTRLSQYRFAANALAAQGYTVLFPHYFESTGDRRISYGDIKIKYSTWLRSLGAVLDAIVQDRSIEARRLAVVGITLGGALALSLASRAPPRSHNQLFRLSAR